MAIEHPTGTMMEKIQSHIPSFIPPPPTWLRTYEDFVTKNASQVSQIESALRSISYIIPGLLISVRPFFFKKKKKTAADLNCLTGRFRESELASESRM